MKCLEEISFVLCIFSIGVVKVQCILNVNTRKDYVDMVKNVPSDTKNDLLNTFDSAKTFIQDSKDSINFNIEKVERVPVPDLIKKEGYPVENHTVTTSDGYILSLHRIPHGKNNKKNGKVVLLQHGLLASSADWILFGPTHGLAYILADEGYDVWMGNSRGNIYSRQHTNMSADGILYWGFSWHEMGINDLPAMIDYILKESNKTDLYYVGHGQGNTAFYVMASEKPEYNQKIKAQISLAPVGYMGNLFSPMLRMIAARLMFTESLFQFVGNKEFMPSSGLFNSLTDTACGAGVGKVLCKNALFAVSGFSPKQINSSSIPLIMAHYPAGSSAKQVLHYVQEINSRRFCKFDYGPLNLINYKFPLPPAYDMSKVTAPVIFIYSHNDWLAAEIDILNLFGKFNHDKEKYRIPHQNWNHLDFIFGNDAPSVIYSKVVEYLNKY